MKYLISVILLIASSALMAVDGSSIYANQYKEAVVIDNLQPESSMVETKEVVVSGDASLLPMNTDSYDTYKSH